MSRATFRQVLRYRFDSFMARGGSSIFLSLVLFFLGSLAVIAGLRALTLLLDPDGAEHIDGFLAHLYVIFLQLTDPGNMSVEIASSPWYKVSAVVAGLIGVIILSMLIAFITTALDQKLNQLKKGHSKVIEQDHTLILGWSDRVLEILRELVLANESEDDPCAVILSEQDKEMMDDYLAVHLPDPANTRIVTRSGSVSSLVNLEIVSMTASKSVIVLAYCSDADSDAEKAASDARVIKTILGLMASKDPEHELNIVAELFDELNRDIAQRISPDEVTTVHGLDVLAKILVQTSRSIGLSVVYNEVMSFDGCELYFFSDEWGELPFGRLQYHFPDGVPMGIRRADGELLINPPAATPMRPDDDVLILAEDDSTIEFRKQPVAQARDLVPPQRKLEQRVEHELILGWNPKAPIILREYSDYVLADSTINVMIREPSEEIRRELKALEEELPDLVIALIDQDPMKAENLIEAQPFMYDNIIILSQSGEHANSETTDSETIILLLLLRSISEKTTRRAASTKLIGEVMDSENQELVARAGVNDFIISNKLVSMLLAQVSEEADIKRVYDDLFSEEGSEIYLKPASLYFDAFPAEVTFADLMAIAQNREEICIGIKLKERERDSEQNYGVKLIPEKNTSYVLGEEDCLIVLAEDET
ncbi:MAG: hypothetical protein GY719_39345 [bacterium]|nr:hypothetical protein [bacterium]